MNLASGEQQQHARRYAHGQHAVLRHQLVRQMRERMRRPFVQRHPRQHRRAAQKARRRGYEQQRRGENHRHAQDDLPRQFLIGLVQAYRWLLKPWLGSACRFEPTCSAYALQALDRQLQDAAQPLGRGQADLVIVRGDPTTTPRDLYNVITVFREGIGYDSAKLREAARGLVGVR